MIQRLRVTKLLKQKSYDKETKTASINFNEKNEACKTQSFYILLAF